MVQINKIDIGSEIPRFSLPDQNGNLFNIDSVLYKKNLVLYFYPRDESPGCTREACHFRDEIEAFRNADALIIGISAQSVKSHKKFEEKYKLPYTLLSDQGNMVRKMFGVESDFLGLIPGRVTFVVDKSGKVISKFNSQMDVLKHVDSALEALNKNK